MKNVLTTVALGAALVFATVGGASAQNHRHYNHNHHHHYDAWRGYRHVAPAPYFYGPSVVYTQPYYGYYEPRPNYYYGRNRCDLGIALGDTCVGFGSSRW